MRAALIAALLLAGCERGNQPAAPGAEAGLNGPTDAANSQANGAGWDLQPSGEGTALALLGASGETVLRLFCTAGSNRLLVNVPAFRPIGSEERLSFGSGDEAVALVADSRGDPQRGGVTGSGPVPDNLGAIVAGPISVSYGAQTSGPHAAASEDLARAFAAACSESPRGEPASPPGAEPPSSADAGAVGACRMQDGQVLPPNLLKAVGTEPFWAARIEGRCVTYMTPENQQGTRIWTRFVGSRDSGVWTGFYRDEQFVLRTRRSPGCSDGMSDKRYPVGVTLSVGGEERLGCAEWL